MSDPLNLRLRAEAAEWDEGETIVPLLIEAAEAIELLAANAAIEAQTDESLHAEALGGCT